MVFCPLNNAGSVREMSKGLSSITGKLVQPGCKQAPDKSSISSINRKSVHKVYETFFHLLFQHPVRHIGFERTKLRQLKRKVFLMDSTVIPWFSNIFDLAHFRKHKGAVKLHTCQGQDVL